MHENTKTATSNELLKLFFIQILFSILNSVGAAQPHQQVRSADQARRISGIQATGLRPWITRIRTTMMASNSNK